MKTIELLEQNLFKDFDNLYLRNSFLSKARKPKVIGEMIQSCLHLKQKVFAWLKVAETILKDECKIGLNIYKPYETKDQYGRDFAKDGHNNSSQPHTCAPLQCYFVGLPVKKSLFPVP